MRLLAISSQPVSERQLRRFERVGCRVVAKTSAEDTFFAVLRCLEPDHGLTQRQLGVLQLAARGSSVEDIAQNLHIGRKTVERHLRNCRYRLSATNDVQLGAVAERMGL